MLKSSLILLITFVLLGCSETDRVEYCKAQGFKGIVVDDANYIYCSDGDIKNNAFITTRGLKAFEIKTRTETYRHYFLKFYSKQDEK